MTVDKSPQKIKDLFDKIAPIYDFANNFISLFTHKKIKKSAIKELSLIGNEKILDCCTGTGDIAGFIKQKYPNCEVIGIDFSQNMLNVAKQKFPSVNFIKGDCCNLAFNSEAFDCITIAFGLRNIKDYPKAISEIKRVLKKDGKLLYIDFDKSGILNKILDIIIAIGIKIFKFNNDEYSYLIKSKNEFLTTSEILNLFTEYGFITQKRISHHFGCIPTIIFKKK